MAMIRAYAMSHDAFSRASRSMRLGGAYHQFPFGPAMRRAGKAETAREKLDSALESYSILDQLKFVLQYTSMTMKETHDGLWLAFQSSKRDGTGSKQAKLADFQRKVAEIKERIQPHLWLVMDYAVRMNNKVARAMDMQFEHLPKDLKGYEIFADQAARTTLSEAIVMGTWVVYHLNKNPKQVKPSYMKITDSEIQMILANSAKKGLSPTFADDLRKEIANEHERHFASVEQLNGMCKKIKGHTISFVNVKTNEKVPQEFIKWTTAANGEQNIEIDEAAMKAAGKDGEYPRLEADRVAGHLVAECDNVIMVDGTRPYILPAPPMTQNQFSDMISRVQASMGGESLWFKSKGKMVTADPRALKGFLENSTNPVFGEIGGKSNDSSWTKAQAKGRSTVDQISGVDSAQYRRLVKGEKL